jgi:hypothetical protein
MHHYATVDYEKQALRALQYIKDRNPGVSIHSRSLQSVIKDYCIVNNELPRSWKGTSFRNLTDFVKYLEKKNYIKLNPDGRIVNIESTTYVEGGAPSEGTEKDEHHQPKRRKVMDLTMSPDDQRSTVRLPPIQYDLLANDALGTSPTPVPPSLPSSFNSPPPPPPPHPSQKVENPAPKKRVYIDLDYSFGYEPSSLPSLPPPPPPSFKRKPPTPICPVCNQLLPDMNEQQINTHIDECLTKDYLKTEKPQVEQEDIFVEDVSNYSEPLTFTCPYPTCQIPNIQMSAVEFAGHVASTHQSDPNQNIFCPICRLIGEDEDVGPNLHLWRHLNSIHADILGTVKITPNVTANPMPNPNINNTSNNPMDVGSLFNLPQVLQSPKPPPTIPSQTTIAAPRFRPSPPVSTQLFTFNPPPFPNNTNTSVPRMPPPPVPHPSPAHSNVIAQRRLHAPIKRHHLPPQPPPVQIQTNTTTTTTSTISTTSAGGGSQYVAYELQKNLPESECSICYEDFLQGQNVARMECMCVFHKHCIDEWFVKKHHCPLHAPPDTAN